MAEVRCETTIWIWPSGLFPRRLVYYFRAKGITLRVLQQHRISIIPVELTSLPPALHSMAGFEARPDNSSLPTMRIEYSDGRTAWIRESLSIIDYFEDLFPSPANGVNVRGSSAEQNAQVQDILNLLNDAMHWSLIHLIHADPRTMLFSGLKKEEMSASTASHATKKLHFYLERLEQWLQADSHVKSFVLPSLALLAQVDYHEMMYGTDWLDGHQVLKQWVGEVRGEPWFVSNNGLKSVERGEG